MRTLVIFERILKELSRDKRTLALVFLAPLLVLGLLYLILQSNTNLSARLGTENVSPNLMKQLKKNSKINLVAINNKRSISRNLKKYHLAALLKQKNQKLTVTYQNADTSLTAVVKENLVKSITKDQIKSIKSKINQSQQELNSVIKSLPTTEQKAIESKLGSKKNGNSLSLLEKYIYGNANSSLFTAIAPVLVGFLVFFFVFLISGVSLLHERTTETLGRLLTSPVKRQEIIAGYVGAYGLLAILQTIVVVIYAIYVLGINSRGSIWLVMLINLLLALVALSMGLLVSTLASSEFQMIQFIPILIVPQVFFSGMFNLSDMNSFWRIFAHIFPMYYGGDALIDVIKKGAGIENIGIDLLILAAFAVILISINIIGLRRYRRV
ncbi:ABC transporter permease [Oenococcus oeni]|uniref:ABC transporter permease n=1 Tax=Oenococcus oeni TaxID=1247 RepID=UPI000277B4C3|nr:ABC transporter permease [Oenococcus oeni]EJO05739.1 ABC-type multidrug transport system, permease component [Oenococcus oeni AWRIB422]EJO07503.1 ABC-type multidrug transport system, permease component [Oenococcus oeni AWRIB548]KEP86921.1 multidrug ABC transporter permease [Oenococcus oeni IOEB_0205]KGH68339.1 multidrug ABC transporter permease [Oenococcus oeni IOEB_B16]OIL82000.1 multidrug ABC transporter permease [Oenococcus oeni]